MTGVHEHVQVPDNPSNGDTIACDCGYEAEFVALDNGRPGEWMQTSAT